MGKGIALRKDPVILPKWSMDTRKNQGDSYQIFCKVPNGLYVFLIVR
jgi:hypothetical protein